MVIVPLNISLTFPVCRRGSFSLATVLPSPVTGPVSSADVDIRYRTGYAHKSLAKTVYATVATLTHRSGGELRRV